MATGGRVLIADDHAPTRAALRAALEQGGFVVCTECGDAICAVEATVDDLPDIALLDINMPGSGIAAAAQITMRVPGVSVVMLTVSQEDDDLFSALLAGAVGYLLKGQDYDRIPTALEAVLDGEAALPRSLTARVIDEFRRRGRRRRLSLARDAASLSEREWEVLELMDRGLSTREIADHMFVSPVTVRTHVSSILKKLRVSDRTAAVELLREADTRPTDLDRET